MVMAIGLPAFAVIYMEKSLAQTAGSHINVGIIGHQ